MLNEITAGLRKAFDDIVPSAERIVPWVKSYLDFTKLDKFMETEKGAKSAYDSISIVLLAQTISVFTLMAGFAVSAFLYPSQILPIIGQLFLGLIVIVLLLGALVYYLSSGVVYLISKLLGGNGDLSSQLRVMAIASLCSNVVAAPFAFLNIVLMQNTSAAAPIMACLLITGFYEIYVFFKALRAVHRLSALRSVVTILATILILYVISSLFVYSLSG